MTNLRHRVNSFVRTTCGNVIALVEATEKQTFSDDNVESIEAVVDCLALIFERSSKTLKKMLANAVEAECLKEEIKS